MKFEVKRGEARRGEARRGEANSYPHCSPSIKLNVAVCKLHRTKGGSVVIGNKVSVQMYWKEGKFSEKVALAGSSGRGGRDKGD